MFTGILVLAVFAASPVLTGVLKETEDRCGFQEVSCGDGTCVSNSLVCDGLRQCADGSDEEGCLGFKESKPSRSTVITRSKRQTRRCNNRQWQCRDGTCIGFDGKCDGVVDCPDGSDESFPLCRKSQCQSNWFRCTYGACVDGTAPCNGIQDCADNSDELLPRCRNETEEVRGKFTCDNGQEISAAEHCDGLVDCSDGSDETVKTCAAKPCPAYLFRCAYGACVDQGADCNGARECADGSDESDELCNRISPAKPNNTNVTPKPPGGKCVLPPLPEHGRYEVGGLPSAAPGQAFPSLQVNFTCNRGYGIIGETLLFCFDGTWSREFPQCVRFCQLKPHPSVEYRCVVSDNSVEGTRDCNANEPSGTTVRPQCRVPNYYYPGVLNLMQCIDGSWDYIAICNPGLHKHGTNITILLKDQIEFYINNFTYQVPLFDLPLKANAQNYKPNKPTFVIKLPDDIKPGTNRDVFNLSMPYISVTGEIGVPVKEDHESDYDIDQNDWRLGSANNVNVNINNSNVVINSDNVKVRNFNGKNNYKV